MSMLDQVKVRALSDAGLAKRITAVMSVVRGMSYGETREDFLAAIAQIGHFPQEGYEAMLDELCSERARRRSYVPWTPFERAYVNPLDFYTVEAQERFTILAQKQGCTMEEMRETYLSLLQDEIYKNSRYQCAVRRSPVETENGPMEMVHISVKRLDQQTIHDWRDLNRIKRELLGPEVEAIELYPADSRMIDTANQYHLWAINDPTYRWPVGWSEGRLTMDEDEAPGVGQRPFEV